MSDSPHQPHGGSLTIRSERQGDAQLITLDGEMDGSNARDLEEELIRVEATSAPTIVLDLTSLEFIDSTGLAVIVRADRRAEHNEHSFEIKRPRGTVGRTFERWGLDKTLSLVT